MLKFSVIVLILLLFVGLYAFDDPSQLEGTVNRPGYSNLQLKTDEPSGALTTGSYYAENDLVGTPKVMFARYRSSSDPENFKGIADDFIAGNYDRLKNNPEDFRVTSGKLILNKFYFINLVQTYNDIDLWGSRLGLKATPDGVVFLAGGEIFSNIEINSMPNYSLEAARVSAITGIIYDSSTDYITDGELKILPLIFDDEILYHLCYKFNVSTKEPLADWQVFVDAHDGTVLWRENLIRYETVSGNVTGYMQPATPYDDEEIGPYPNEDIFADGSVVATTDSDGYYSFDLLSSTDFTVLLQGPYMNINNQVDQDAIFMTTVNPGDVLDVEWNDDNSTLPERDAYYHGQMVHDFVKSIDPGATFMDFPMTCRVFVEGTCNAFYSRQDRSINFYRAGGGCSNTAQIADVVYHEYGHGLTNIQYSSGGSDDPNGAMHEGFSDAIAGFITDQPLIGRGFYGPGSYLRTIDNNNRYPEDWIGESHHDGLIMGGALWDLKQMLDNDRPGYADTLWQFAKYGYSADFYNYFWDVLAVDDDDGDLDNGTPHAYEIFYSFGELHGIGPGVPIEIEHTPLLDVEDSTVVFPLEATVTSLFTMDEGSVTIHYSTGGEYDQIAMTNTSGDLWFGEIPNQSFGTTVDYYIEVIDHANLRKYSPEDAPDSVYSFFVGFDIIPPVLTDDTGPRNTINLNGPYGPFGFQAWDMHGIDETSGQLHYRINEGAENVSSMSVGDLEGEFELDMLDLGQTLESGDVISYYFTCLDLAINPNTGRLPETGIFSFEMAASELIDHFEDGIDNWTVVGEGWIFYDRQGYQSSNCIKTGEQFYTDNANSIIYFNTPFDLTLYDNAWLEFRFKTYLLEGDSCFAIAATDPAGPWTRFDGISDMANYWSLTTLPLVGMAGPGQDEVYVGLQFISDESDNHFGILVDDVTIRIRELTSISSTDQLPEKYTLRQNYPNPFNMNTIIEFSIPKNSSVRLDIYDLLGRKVVRLLDTDLAAGIHRTKWNGRNESGEAVTSGIYFYRLEYEDQSEIKSMTLIK